ncbi:hypothetical protein [Corynebacterium mastitidis]|uniref:hypothetical protein n=1 Tax=Corynebacterium mastitidis TaxID=161890 RepID=UPI00254CB5C3|nr:hypothetical protein [Corynebacterium mastitidis]MDK8449814.1 hypothetical protein [Corynebacterium mastitidis]
MGNAAFFEGAEKYADYVKDSGQDAAKAIGTSVDDVAKAARIGGYATTGVGVGIGAGADIKNGMDPTEAWVTNSIGGVASLAVVGTAAVLWPAAPVLLVGAASVIAGTYATKKSQELRNDHYGEKED